MAANKPPVYNGGMAAQKLEEGRIFGFSIPSGSFKDPEGGALKLKAEVVDASGKAQPLPSWLMFNPITGSFIGVPPPGAPDFTIRVTATDKGGLSSSGTFNITTPTPNRPPQYAGGITVQKWEEGKAFSYGIPAGSFKDPEGGALKYTASVVDASGRVQPLPSWLKFDAAKGSFSGTPPAGSPDLIVRLTATDNGGLSSSVLFGVSTPAANKAPTYSGSLSAQKWEEGKAFNFGIPSGTFKDPEGGALNYKAEVVDASGKVQPLPSWLKFDAAKGTFSGTPPAGAADLTVRVTATDAGGLSTSGTFNVATPAANKAPTYSGGLSAQKWDEGKAFSFGIPSGTFKDPEGGALNYKAEVVDASGKSQPLPSWLKFDAAKGTFSGTPPAGAPDLTVRVTATDAGGLSTSGTFNVTTPGTTKPTSNALADLMTDAKMKSNVMAAILDGSINYNEMLTILNDVKTSGVSASEFTDLKNLLSNVNNGYTMSSYVYDVSSKLVFGNAANANWHGGSSSQIALGNLSAGTSVDNMDKLIQKWFMGGDLPDATDANGRGHTYRTSNQPLFGTGGVPSINDINQGCLGDCYLLASLTDIAYTEPSAIQSMFQDNGNGTYGVRFFTGGKENWVTVNRSLATYDNGSAVFNSSQNIWSSLIEKAYVQLNESGVLNQDKYKNSFNAISGGWGDPITEITGRSMSYYSSTNNAGWDGLKNSFVTAISQKQELWVASFGNSSINGKTSFVSGHAFSVVGYNASTGNFVLRNPWGTKTGQYWVTQFEASMSDLKANSAVIGVASAGASKGVSGNYTGKPVADVAGAFDVMNQSLAYKDTLGVGNDSSGGLPDLNTQKSSNLLANG